jgi:glycosyltransferase involved in cell wall biosynthesis
VAVRLAAGQAHFGHEVTVAHCPLGEEQGAFDQMVARIPEWNRVRRLTLTSQHGLSEKVFAHKTAEALRPAIDEADVVHLHNVWESALRVTAKRARELRVPYFIQPNDMLTPWSLKQKAIKKSLALSFGYRQMIEGAAALLFGHPQEMALGQEAGFRVKHVWTNLGGVFAEEVRPLPAPGSFYKRYPQLGGKPFVLFLGRWHFKKGVDILAEAFADLCKRNADVQLVMVGVDDGAEADFRERIKKHKIEPRVHMVGQLHGEAKWEAYRDALCFILPSRDEAYTIAITEALASGAPVIISDTCHNDDIGHAGAGLIVPLDPVSKIADAILRIAGDAKLRQSMCESAGRYFEQHLDFVNAARETLDLYHDAIAATERVTV